MSCEHAQSTTLLWLWGEYEEGHATHVAECEPCQAVVALHTEVVCATPPALGERRSVSMYPARSAMLVVAGLALAAAALLSTLGQTLNTSDEVTLSMAAVDIELPGDDLEPWFAELDRDMDALDVDLSAL